jgi:hypothetical protein
MTEMDDPSPTDFLVSALWPGTHHSQDRPAQHALAGRSPVTIQWPVNSSSTGCRPWRPVVSR